MSEPTILDRIVAQRRLDVAAAKASVSETELRKRLAAAPPLIAFRQRLEASAPMAVIAEIKRASPSKGDIAPGIDAAVQGALYARAGAAAISVLTEPTWFKGTLTDMRQVRDAVGSSALARPAILRKDFIVDPYQVFEARVHGADAILLIVASLDDDHLAALLSLSRDLGMEPLVEVNNAEEMGRARMAGASVVGINNRDLRSFTVDLGTTDRLADGAPKDGLLCALSGISSRADVERFAAAGAGAVLVGEALMVAADPRAKLQELLGTTASVGRR